MNKAQLVARVARDTGLTRADVLRVLDGVLETVVRALHKGEPVKLVDFGTFLVTRRKPRAGHNPHTGQAMRMPARRARASRPARACGLSCGSGPRRCPARARGAAGGA